MRYEPGVLTAKVYRHGKLIAQQTSATAGLAAAIGLRADWTQLAADGGDVAVVAVRITDAKDRFVPQADNLVEFSVTGPGKIIGVGNGDPASRESEVAPQRKAFNGLCMVLVETTDAPGTITLTAKSKGLAAQTLALVSQTN